MEWLQNIGVWVLSLVGGISIGGILGLIFWACFKGLITKAIARINVKKIATEATEEVLERIKKVGFKQSIQPVVESELVKINEKADGALKAKLKETDKKLDAIHEEIKALAKYFDNSLGVTDEAKHGLKVAINNYEKLTAETEQEIFVVEEEVKPTRKAEKKAIVSENIDTDVER